MYLVGDVLIISFPFSNGVGSKRRPVMVIKDTGDSDLLVAKITSQSYITEFDIPIVDWQQAQLLSPSIVRVHKIQTLQYSLVIGNIGRLSINDRKKINEGFRNLLLSL